MLRTSLRRAAAITAAVSLLLSGVGAAVESTAPPTEITACGTIDESGTYVLVGDVRGGGQFTNPCLVVTADDVTIDGNNHLVSSLATRGNAIANLSVENLRTPYSLELTNVTDGRVAGVDGRVRVIDSRNVMVADSRLVSASVGRSENVTVADNRVANGSVSLSSTSNSTVTRNRPADGSYATYEIQYSDDNALVDNVARSGGAYPEQGGFHAAYGSNDNLFANNTVVPTDDIRFDYFDPYGFTFWGSDSNRLTNNTVELREEVAYYASGSTNTVVNLTLSDGTNATFTGDNVAVSAATETPAPPAGYAAIGYYVEAQSIEPSGQGSWFAPTVGYNETAAEDVDESTLRFWQHGNDTYAPLGRLANASDGENDAGGDVGNAGVWRRIGGINNVGGVNDVDVERNVITANVTNLGAENRLVFRDQVTNGSNVTVESVALPRPGFVVITDEAETVRGVSAYLPAGVHKDVQIRFAHPLDADATLTAVAQSDANDDRQYGADTVRPECMFAAPNGTPLRDAAQVDLIRSDLTPTIASVDRPVANSLSVSATLPAGGFVVVSGPDPLGDEGEYPTAGASGYLEPGTHENVTIELADYLREMARNASDGSVEVVVWLIRDDGNQELDWLYNFPGPDWPYEVNGGVVTESLTLSYEDDANETAMPPRVHPSAREVGA